MSLSYLSATPNLLHKDNAVAHCLVDFPELESIHMYASEVIPSFNVERPFWPMNSGVA